MSAQGIIPDPGYGGIVVTTLPAPAGVSNAYVPPTSFTVSSNLNFYGANCSANRFDPQQLNAFESEMLALAATINPNGTWNTGSVTNLANAFATWAAGITSGGVSLATAADYPGSASSDIAAATPAYVAAAIAAGFTSPLAVTHNAAYPSSNDTLGATAAYINTAINAKTAANTAYPGSAASNTLFSTPAYVRDAIAAATTTIEALIPAKTAAAAYPSSSDAAAYTTPAYVANAMTAAIATAESIFPAATMAAAYPSGSDSTYATPAYVAAAVSGASGYTLTIANNGTNVDTAATLINFINATSISTSGHHVTVTLPTGGASTYAALTDVAVSSLQNKQLAAWNSGTSKWNNIDAPYNVGAFAAGVLGPSELFFAHAFPYAVEIASSAPNSQAVAHTAATGSTTVTINKNGSSIGTIAWASSGTVGVFTFASSVTFAAGDVISLVAPSSADATLADISITLAGFRI